MTTTLDEAQEGILARLRTIPQPVYEIAIPDTGTVLKSADGEIEPYVAIQFGDPQREGQRNIATTVLDSHVLPVYVQVIGPTAKICRQLANKVVVTLLGYSVPHGGQLTKRSGGPIYSITATTGAVEAYLMPSSYGAFIEIRDLV